MEEEEVVEAELVLPLPVVVVDPAVVELPVDSDDGAEGLPVDPVEAEALQRGRQDSRRQGRRGT